MLTRLNINQSATLSLFISQCNKKNTLKTETTEIDFFPSVWREEIHDDSYIEWIYKQDETILVRLDGTGGKGNYTVYPITGVNSDAEEFITSPISRFSREQAFELTVTLLYTMNGVIDRVNGNHQFCGDKWNLREEQH